MVLDSMVATGNDVGPRGEGGGGTGGLSGGLPVGGERGQAVQVVRRRRRGGLDGAFAVRADLSPLSPPRSWSSGRRKGDGVEARW